MVVKSRTKCEYPQLIMSEHPELTDRELEYFKMPPNELKCGFVLEGIFGGVMIVIGVILFVIALEAKRLFYFDRMFFGFVFSLFLLVFGAAFIYNAITVRVNSWERFKNGQIRPAELIIPNAYFIIERIPNSRNRITHKYQLRRCCTGIWNGKKHVVEMKKKEEDGITRCVYLSVDQELKEEAKSYIGRRCLAKVEYRRGKVWGIEAFLDEVYD